MSHPKDIYLILLGGSVFEEFHTCSTIQRYSFTYQSHIILKRFYPTVPFDKERGCLMATRELEDIAWSRAAQDNGQLLSSSLPQIPILPPFLNKISAFGETQAQNFQSIWFLLSLFLSCEFEQWAEGMDGGKRHQSLKLAILVFHPLLALLIATTPVRALNVGIHSVNSDIAESKQQQCSRTCESQHCNVPPLLKYGKYCGILYSGCPGEKPCDALDACCMTHDKCVQSKHNDYLNVECNENLLNCMAAVRESGEGTFKGNKCMVEEVVDVITLVIEAALLAGRIVHKP